VSSGRPRGSPSAPVVAAGHHRAPGCDETGPTGAGEHSATARARTNPVSTTMCGKPGQHFNYPRNLHALLAWYGDVRGVLCVGPEPGGQACLEGATARLREMIGERVLRRRTGPEHGAFADLALRRHGGELPGLSVRAAAAVHGALAGNRAAGWRRTAATRRASGARRLFSPKWATERPGANLPRGAPQPQPAARQAGTAWLQPSSTLRPPWRQREFPVPAPNPTRDFFLCCSPRRHCSTPMGQTKARCWPRDGREVRGAGSFNEAPQRSAAGRYGEG